MLGDSFRIAKSDFISISRDKFKLFAIFVIILLPLAYGVLYLWAFWNPYGNVDKIPLAIVNLDMGGNNNGTYTNAGDELVSRLQKESNISFSVVSLTKAHAGLSQRQYYGVLTIPKDFTQNILSITNPSPHNATLVFESRDATSFLGAKIARSIAEELAQETNKHVSDLYIEEALRQLPSLRENISKMNTGTGDLQTGLREAYDGSVDLKEGLQEINDGSDQLSRGLISLSDASSALASGSNMLSQSSTNLSFALDTIFLSLSKLHAAGMINDSSYAQMLLVKEKKNQLFFAQQTLSDELATYNESIATAAASAQSLDSGINKAYHGSEDLSDGIRQAYRGATNISSEVNKEQGRLDREYPDERIRSIAYMQLHPVELKQDQTTEITYGTGLAPYFIQLSLWVGGLILLLVISPKELKLALSGFSRRSITLGKFIVPASIGMLQALVLDLILFNVLGLEVKHTFLFVLFTILLSWTFIAIIQFFIFLFGKAGEIPAILLLMLQLTSSAGTFPVETSPAFFQNVNPLLPMTYGVIGLRELILERSLSIATTEFIIIAGFLVGALIIRMLMTRKKITLLDLHPPLEI